MEKKMTSSLVLMVMLLLQIGGSLGGACRPSDCAKRNIVIVQGEGPPEFTGIPSFMVEISNQADHPIADIHLKCGWFSSARLINPKIFRRLGFNDCLVNDGKPLVSGYSLSFQYTTTFQAPLSVSSIRCVCA